jgi:chromosome segregation ATPase
MDSPQTGTDMPPSTHERSAAPPVRVEVRHGAAPPVGLDVAGEEFVVGSVPGCDLRIPGANLPPHVCSIRRGPDGVWLQKIAQALPILLNGSPLSPAGQAVLRHGDVVSIGAVDLHISIAFSVPEPVPMSSPAHDESVRKQRELEVRAKAIEEQARELEADRVLWYERRQEMEREIKAAREGLEANRRKPTEDPALLTELRAKVEKEVAEEYRARRDELERVQLAVREAAVQLKEAKQRHEEAVKNVDPRVRELERRERAFADRERLVQAEAAEVQRRRDAFAAEQKVQEVRLHQREQDLARREVELAARELATRELAAAAERDREQYQTDLVRVDRLSAALEGKEKSLEQRAVEIDRRYEQFQNDTRDFEEHLRHFDDREERAKDEDSRLAARREELDTREAKLNARLAEIETQQTGLVALRTRLEHLRDELRAQEARISDERARMEEDSLATEERLREAEAVREEVESEKTGHEESFRLYQERSALMSQAVERLRGMQEQIAAEGERLRQLDEELSAKSAGQAEQAGLLQARTEQLAEAHERIEADRRALKERDATLLQAEEAREALQEQLRLRSEDLANRQREIDDRSRQLDEQAKELGEQIKQLEDLRADATSARRLTEEEAAILAQRDEKLRAAEQTIADQRKQLEDAQARFDNDRIEAEYKLDRAKAEIEELKDALSVRTAELLGQMPDLEQRAQAALDRTAQAREAMRSQLAELHAYALKSQEDLQAVRTQVQEELGRLRDQEQSLSRARSEHRLAVSSFRQQLIEWQSRFSTMKQALHQGETRLDRREKQVEAAAHEVAERAERVQQQEAEVIEKQAEVDHHLGDMQAWFRKKFREIAETRWSKFRGAGDSAILPMPPRPDNSVPSSEYSESVILPLLDDLDPADRKLGELLRTLNIVEKDTLHALWDDARRQRRTLRQVLLSGGYLTLYQLALIESGNLSGLMLGRFRVIDRLMSTPREAIYRVFDPQAAADSPGAGTCLLRHLGEAEALDAVRPDEYRQRFGAARDLAHPNVAATLEVLDVNSRPAVVQEWLTGLPGGDWPAAVASSGVWHRLMMQAAQGLHAAHSVGLTHGRLAANSFLLTRPGVVKMIGIGEPPWLHAGWVGHEATPEDDLKALGQVALGWMHAGRRKAVKVKPFPPGLIAILRSLGVSPDEGVPLGVYPSAAALLEDLDRAAEEVPPDNATWDKLLSYVGENAGDGIVLRQSA